MEKARITINQVFAPLKGNIRERARNMLKDRIVVVVGYQGLDEFDVIPLLFDESHPRTIIWLVHSEIDPSIRTKLEDRHYNYFKANISDYVNVSVPTIQHRLKDAGYKFDRGQVIKA